MNLFAVPFFLFSLYTSVEGLTFSIKLSSDLSLRHRGQLLAYFTFTSGSASNSLSVQVVKGNPAKAARLYLFAVGTQNLLQTGTPEACVNFYKMSIYNVSLTHEQGEYKFGSFSGYFPTFLLYADECTCASTPCPAPAEVDARITLLNPNGEPLSATLIGLRTHCFGLIIFYLLAIVYTLYFVRLAMCCTAACEALVESGRQSVAGHEQSSATFVVPGCESKNLGQAGQFCCGWNGNGLDGGTRMSLLRTDGDERRLFYLVTLLCVQFVSVLFVWLEISRLAKSGSHVLESLHPVTGTDGWYSLVAELLALINQFVMLRMLMFHASDRDGHLCPNHRSNQDSSRQSSHLGTFSNSCSPPSTGRFAISFSIFRFGRPLSWNRTVNFLLLLQVFWYIFNAMDYHGPVYTDPSRWPMEEHHRFWVGLGIPTSRYLPPTFEYGGSNSQQSAKRSILATIFANWSVAFILAVIRSALGLILSTRLLRFSDMHRSEQTRKINTNCGWLGFAWFLAHPLLLFIGTVFADHAKYKFTIVGITLAQASILTTLLFVFTRKTFLWDISSLSASLPVLKRTTSTITASKR